MALKILTYNILEGGGGKNCGSPNPQARALPSRLPEIEKVIKGTGAHVVGLQECRSPQMVTYLADSLRMTPVPGDPEEGENSPGFLSSLKVEHTKVIQNEILEKAAIRMECETPSGNPLVVLNSHPLFSKGTREWTSPEIREKRGAELDFLLKEIAPDLNKNFIWLGDFNCLAPGELPGDSALVEPGVQQEMKDDHFSPLLRLKQAGLVDAFRKVSKEAGLTNPTPLGFKYHPEPSDRIKQARGKIPTPWYRFDMFWISPVLAPSIRSCRVLSENNAEAASDHFPVLLEIDLD